MNKTKRNHQFQKPLSYTQMAENLCSYWLFNRSYQPTALRPKCISMVVGRDEYCLLMVAINFVHRTIELGYHWQIPCDKPMGSASPDEIYLIARDCVRLRNEGNDPYSASEWQSLLLEALENVNADLQTAEITDAFKHKVITYLTGNGILE